MPQVLEIALAQRAGPAEGTHIPRRLRDYAAKNPAIVVAPVVASVESGSLEILGGNVPIVDALLAACATVPLFPAVELPPPQGGLYIDGINVSNEAIEPLMNHLRRSPCLPERTFWTCIPCRLCLSRLRRRSVAVLRTRASSRL